MGLLGKVLAILNVLAAAAFVYLAAADWSKRQQWAFAAVRFDEVVDGLPVDDHQKDPNEDSVLTVRYEKATPMQLQGTTGAAVTTQEQEVRRVHDDVKNDIQNTTRASALEQFNAELQAAPGKLAQRLRVASITLPLAKSDAERTAWAGQIFDPAVPVTGKTSVLARVIHDDQSAQRARLAQVLLPLAEIGDERDALAQKIATAKMDELLGDEGPLEVTFKKALKQEHPGVNEKDNYNGKRAAIAHLLVNLGRNDNTLENWYRRVVAVVGYQAFADAANGQAQAFHDMTARVNLATQGDLHNFLIRHQAVLEVLHALNDQIKQRNAELVQHQEQESRYASLVKDRAAERDQYQKDLQKARLNLQAALKSQQDEERALGMGEQEVRRGQQANEALLQQIRKLEQLGQ